MTWTSWALWKPVLEALAFAFVFAFGLLSVIARMSRDAVQEYRETHPS